MYDHATYREHRRGPRPTPAGLALRIARATAAHVEAPDMVAAIEDATNPFRRPTAGRLTRDGYELAITVELDADADMSHLGEFTDTWSPEAIPNPEASYGMRHHYYRWYVPMNSTAEERRYHRAAGYNRHDAYTIARAQALRDMRALLAGPDFYGVTITAYRAGVELARASLWGIDGDDPGYLTMAAEELVPEAIAEARDAESRLCQARHTA